MKIKYFIGLLVGFATHAALAQETPLFYDTDKNGRFINDLNNEAAKYLIAHHSALPFWLIQANYLKPQSERRSVFLLNDPNPVVQNIHTNACGDRALIILFDKYILLDIQAKNIVTSITKTDFANTNFNADGSQFAVVNENQDIAIHSSQNGALIKTIKTDHDAIIVELAFSNGGNLLISNSLDYAIRVWDVNEGTLLHKLQHASRINSVAFDADDGRLATCSSNFAYIWDLKTGKILNILDHGSTLSRISSSHFSRNNCKKVEFHPNKKNQLLTVTEIGDKTQTDIWDLETNSKILTIPYLKCSAFVLDGSYIYGLHSINRTPILLNDKGEKIYEGDACIDAVEILISADKKIAFLLTNDGITYTYDILKGIQINKLYFTMLSTNASKLVGFYVGQIFIISLFDPALKEMLLKNITLDQAQILIDTYKGFYATKIKRDQRSIKAFENFPVEIKNIMNYFKLLEGQSQKTEDTIASMDFDRKKRKIEES